jgi:hypothetical protein
MRHTQVVISSQPDKFLFGLREFIIHFSLAAVTEIIFMLGKLVGTESFKYNI